MIDKNGKEVTKSVLFVVGVLVAVSLLLMVALVVAIIAALLKWAF